MGIKIEGQLIKKSLVQKMNQQIKRGLGEIAGSVKLQIRQRTESGLDVNRAGFRPYSVRYAAYRRDVLKRPSSPVDLHVSGNMLKAITHKLTGSPPIRRIEVFFSSGAQADKARRHQFGQGGLPKREFFGLDKKQLEEVTAKIRRVIDLTEANK